MLKSDLLHPGILNALAKSGHTSKILIADGNFPFNGLANPAAERVYLNLRPGMVSATDVLATLVSAIPLEAAQAVMKADGSAPSIHAEFAQILQGHVAMTTLALQDFYDAIQHPMLSLVIATGEQRTYANILLTVGVVQPD